MRLSCNKYGSHVVRAAISDAPLEQLVALKSSLSNRDSFIKLCCNEYGNHVMQHVILKCSGSEIAPKIMNAIYQQVSSADTFVTVSNDEHGSHVMQSLLQNSSIHEFEKYFLKSLT